MSSSEEDNKSPSYPLYHKLILAAIAGLGEERSTKPEISSYILTTKKDILPANHEAALSHALEKMKNSGEIFLYKNKYVQPDASSVVKRGRGRPPKLNKSPAASGETSTPRPRGRPPKVKDPLSASIEKAGKGLPRPRGRPPAKHRPLVGESPGKKKAAVKPVVVGVKRGRGRPPKLRAAPAEVAAE